MGFLSLNFEYGEIRPQSRKKSESKYQPLADAISGLNPVFGRDATKQGILQKNMSESSAEYLVKTVLWSRLPCIVEARNNLKVRGLILRADYVSDNRGKFTVQIYVTKMGEKQIVDVE
jgi:hypothetical protein